jgi:hypothetical protein
MSDPREAADREFSDRFRRAYEQTPVPGAEARARIVTAARGRPRPRRGLGLEGWIEPRSITLRPIAAVAVAIALVAVGALLPRLFTGSDRRPSAGNAPAAWLPGTRAVRFVLVNPSASQVALVGDFNGWDAAATPMRRDQPDGAWTVSVSLPPGWHSYAFVVNGTTWVPDPHAPLSPRDDFGTLRSVVVVGEHGV